MVSRVARIAYAVGREALDATKPPHVTRTSRTTLRLQRALFVKAYVHDADRETSDISAIRVSLRHARRHARPQGATHPSETILFGTHITHGCQQRCAIFLSALALLFCRDSNPRPSEEDVFINDFAVSGFQSCYAGYGSACMGIIVRL